jgi:iron complex outermembrane recepter protein
MKNRFNLFRTVAAATLLTGVAPGLAAAQQSAPPAPSAENDAGDTIVVTARKKEEALLDAPVSVSAFGAADIERLQLESIDDVGRFAPSLSFSKTFGRSTDRPVVRGQSNVLANVQFGVESGAAYFVDGIYYPGSIQSLDFGDVERVEVIKGPQSALYGRNSYSGAINFVTRDPGESFQASASVRAGEHGEHEARASIGGPLGENVGARISIRDYSYDGEWTNTVTGKTVGSESTFAISGALEWDLTPNLTMRVRASHSTDDDGPLPLFLQSAAANNCQPGWRSLAAWTQSGSTNRNQYYCGVIRPGTVALNTDAVTGPLPTVAGVPATFTAPFPPFTVRNNYNTADGTAFDGIERDVNLFSAAFGWDIGGSGWMFDLSYGVRNETEKFGTDSDHGSVNFILAPGTEGFFANTSKDDVNDYSIETRISSPSDRRIRASLGTFFYYQENVGNDITFADLEGESTLDDTSTTRNEAVFGLLEADLVENLTITVEGRQANERKTISDNITAGLPATFDAKAEFDNFTPRATVRWKPTEDLNIYAIYSEGVKPGGLNGSIGATVGRPTYDQEEAKNIELGLKGELFDGRLTFATAGYFIESSNVQLTTPIASPTGALNSIVTNQGQGETYGFEVEANFDFNDFLRAGVSYSYTRPEFTEGCDEDQWTLTSGGGRLAFQADGRTPDLTRSTSYDPLTGAALANGSLGSCSIAGKRFPLVPAHQASFNAEWRQPIGDEREFFLGGDVSYESSKFVQVHNLAETGSTTLINARGGLEFGNWTLAAYGKNLGDEDTITLATRWLQIPYSTGFTTNVAPGEVRTPPVTGPITNLGASRSFPRAFFGGLRRGRTFGVELKWRY